MMNIFDTKIKYPVLFDSQFMLLILDIFIWGSILPILLPVGLLFYAYKSILLFFVSKIRKDLSPISLNDLLVARTTVDKKEIVDIGFILKVNGDISLSNLREKFAEHFLSADKDDSFKSLYCTFELFCGYLFFKRTERLNLHEHIREGTLRIDTDPKTYFSSWLHLPYLNDKAARWEMLLLKTEDKKTSYVAFRMHHGLIDGFGMLMIVDKLCGQKSPYLVENQPPASFYDKLSMLIKLPRQVIEYNFMASKATMPFPEMINLEKSDKMFVSWTTLNLESLKSLRRQLKVSFSTLLYVLQTGALRRHLIETGRSSEITETLPVFHTVPRANHPRSRFTNHWTYVKLNTPFANGNPVERVYETENLVNEFMREKKHISTLEYLIGFMNLLPTPFCPLNLQWPMFIYKASLSSMVRASSQYFLFGKEVTNIYHTFCTKDLSPQTVLYTTTASHNNQIDVTLSASKQIVRDQTEMNRMTEKHFGEELEDLINRCTTNIP